MKASLLQRLFDIVARRRCSICRRPLAVEEQCVCASCNLDLPRTDHLLHPYDNPMAQVYWGRVRCVGRAAAFIYYYSHAESARPLYQLKYFSRPEVGASLGRLFGREMVASGFTEGIDLIVPVPLAPRRIRERGYNQSLMLARGLSAVSGIAVDETSVVRTQFEESQTHRDRWRRYDNVKDAFELRRADRLAGKHVLLVDDVVTTGATSCACARVMEQARPACISFASLAFVDPDR
jgi:ComF family protein